MKAARVNVADEKSLCIGLPPIVTEHSRTLILGSMLGMKSLQLRQYYAHTQNAFWKIMTALFDAPVESYEQRIALVKENGLALWDTMKCCVRPGSLDSMIDQKSIIVNDFASLFEKYPAITRVFFNGAASEKEFLRSVLPTLHEKVVARLTFMRLPSTSPAHAGRTFKSKLAEWKAIKR